jgi:hypothetical protein
MLVKPLKKTLFYSVRLLSINDPFELVGRDPYVMYNDLCNITNQYHDLCVIEVFILAVRYMEGGVAKKWWEFT